MLQYAPGNNPKPFRYQLLHSLLFVAVHDLLHFLLDGFEIGIGERALGLEVVEAVSPDEGSEVSPLERELCGRSDPVGDDSFVVVEVFMKYLRKDEIIIRILIIHK